MESTQFLILREMLLNDWLNNFVVFLMDFLEGLRGRLRKTYDMDDTKMYAYRKGLFFAIGSSQMTHAE